MSSNTRLINATQCTHCRKEPDGEVQKLRLCSGCGNTKYCCRECQKADWKNHKKVCSSKDKFAKSGNSHVSKISPLDYYHTVMPESEAARGLMEEIGLSLPAQSRIT